MRMSGTDKIAAKLYDNLEQSFSKEEDLSHIKSAIEKAYEQGYASGWEACDNEAEISAARATASEHYVVDDATGKIEGPFTDDELTQRYRATESDPV